MLKLKRGDLFWVVFAVFIVIAASSLIEGRFSITGFVSLASEGDSDDDGIPDNTDNCPFTYNPDQTDSDGDGAGDACDGCPDDPNKIDSGICGCGAPDDDSDYDGTPDCDDGCPYDGAKTDPGSCGCGVSDDDSDYDGTPDCLDGCPYDGAKTDPGSCGCNVPDDDFDFDSIPDCFDNCVFDSNSDQTDSDSDNIGDVCDSCPYDSENDIDSDGVCGDVDNCPAIYNSDQTDSDNDTFGDACDNCIDTPNPDQNDTDSNELGDACDPLIVSLTPGDLTVLQNKTFTLNATVSCVEGECGNVTVTLDPTQLLRQAATGANATLLKKQTALLAPAVASNLNNHQSRQTQAAKIAAMAAFQDEKIEALQSATIKIPTRKSAAIFANISASSLASQQKPQKSKTNVSEVSAETAKAKSIRAQMGGYVNLYDSNSFVYDLYDGCYMSNGEYDAYDDFYYLSIDEEYYYDGAVSEDGAEEAMCEQQEIEGLYVSRKVFVSSQGNWARYSEIFQNPTESEICADVRIDGDLGSDSETQIIKTSDLDKIFDSGDIWLITDDTDDLGGGDANDPTLGYVFEQENADESIDVAFAQNGDEYPYWQWNDFCVQPDETRILMHWAVQQTNRTAAYDTVLDIEKNFMIDPYSSEISEEELSEVANWEIYKGDVSTTPGDLPFYTTSENPQLCANLASGSSCNLGWLVNATGDYGIWQFFVKLNSTEFGSKSSLKSNVSVMCSDIDDDGICDEADNCINASNPGQEDSDGYAWIECLDESPDVTDAGDDSNFEYDLPFIFQYFGREITHIDVDSNGEIELLESGESCYDCSDYGTHDDGDYYDSIFALNDDLYMDDSDSGYGVCNLGDKVVVQWRGSTYYDSNRDLYPIYFEVVIYQNGDVKWNFKTLNYSDYDYDLYSGLGRNEDSDIDLSYAQSEASTSYYWTSGYESISLMPGDGFADACDNCPLVYNPDQADFDNDSVGDVCDNCIDTPNTGQNDTTETDNFCQSEELYNVEEKGNVAFNEFDEYDGLDATLPDSAVDSKGNLHIVWSGDIYGYWTCDPEIWYKMIAPNGTVLISDTLLTDDDCYWSRQPSIAIDANDSVYFVWHQYTEDTESAELYFGRINPYLDDLDGDSAESDTVQVYETQLTDDDGHRSRNPQISLDSYNDVHIAFLDDSGCALRMPAYMKIDADGNVIAAPVIFDVNCTGSQYANTRVAADSEGNAHVVFCLYANELSCDYENYYSMVDAEGNIAIAPSMFTSDDCYQSSAPTVAVDSNNKVHLFWEEITGCYGNYFEIYYQKINPILAPQDGSAVDVSQITEIPAKRATQKDDCYDSWGPEVMIEKGCSQQQLTLAWKDSRYEWTDMFAREFDTNGNFVTDETLMTPSEYTDDYCYQIECSLSVSAGKGNVYVAWEGQQYSSYYDSYFYHIFLSQASETAGADGVGDACDLCPAGEDSVDSDNDSIADACDNCPLTPNLEQLDSDNDGKGDACSLSFAAGVLKFEAGESTENFMDGVVGNFVPEAEGSTAKLEIAVAGVDSGDTISVFDSNGNSLADFSYNGLSLAAGDADGDGLDELAFGADNGQFGLIKWNNESNRLEIFWTQWMSCSVTDVKIADVTPNSECNEIIALDRCASFSAAVFDSTGVQIAGTGYGGHELAVGDMNDDGVDDVLIFGYNVNGLAVFDVFNNNAYIVDSFNGIALYASSPLQIAAFGNGNIVQTPDWTAELDDSVVDISAVAVETINETSNETINSALVIALTNSSVYGIDSEDGSVVWQKPIAGYYPNEDNGDYLRSLELIKEGDIDLDNSTEVIVGAADGFTYALNAATGDVKAKFDTRGPSGASAVENIDVADLNGDGTFDIVAEQDGSSVVAEVLIFKDIAGTVPGFKIVPTYSEDGTQIEVNITNSAESAKPIVISFVMAANQSINLTNVTITATEGLTVISGLNLPAGVTKTAQVVMPAGSSSVCVKDSEGATLSSSCGETEEVIVACPGSAEAFSCSVITSTLFSVSGLFHSAIGSFTETTSGGGGGRRAETQIIPGNATVPEQQLPTQPQVEAPELIPAEAAPAPEVLPPKEEFPTPELAEAAKKTGFWLVVLLAWGVLVTGTVAAYAISVHSARKREEEFLRQTHPGAYWTDKNKIRK